MPYVGGKSMIADTVWKALGGVTTYVEPFAGSCAVLLARPQPFTGLEIINDANGYVANCWRAIQQHPAQVADHANWPPNECVPTGTLIDTPQGPVPVERIVLGTIVWGERDGRVVPTVVRATQSSEARDFTKIGVLRVTGNHPVMTQEHGYLPANDLRPGMNVWKLTYPSLEYVLGVLHSDHGQAMGDLRVGGPAYERDSVCRCDISGTTTVQRTHVESSDRGAYAPGLLDQVSHRAGASTHSLCAGTGDRGGVAGTGEVLDRTAPSDGGSGQPHGRWGGVPGVCPNPGASCQMVCNAEGCAVCTRTCTRNEREAPPPGGAGEDPRSRYRTEEDRGDQETNVRCGEAPWDGSRTRGTSEARGVCRDWGVLRVSGHFGQIPQSEQVHDLTSNPQRVSLQRESLQVWVRVHNFETDTGNYFAEGVLVHNCDLHARHRWLWERGDQLQGQLESDPDWCDTRIAGWWLWGMANFFTGAFCVRERPNRCKLLMNNHGIMGLTSDPLLWMQELQDRMRRVKVLCGDFKRALTPSVVGNYPGRPCPPVGVFLDPPYDGGDTRVYGAQNSASIFQETLDWALANASPTVRVVLAGYDSRPMPEGWRELAWKGHGGHGRRKDNKENTNQDRERLWLSPSCLNPDSESHVTSLDELLGM